MTDSTHPARRCMELTLQLGYGVCDLEDRADILGRVEQWMDYMFAVHGAWSRVEDESELHANLLALEAAR